MTRNTYNINIYVVGEGQATCIMKCGSYMMNSERFQEENAPEFII
jgi:hypothetical protein